MFWKSKRRRRRRREWWWCWCWCCRSRSSVHLTIHLSTLSFFFFSFVAHNENWHEKLEMTENRRRRRRRRGRRRRRHCLFLFPIYFHTVVFCFSTLICAGKTRRHTLSVESKLQLNIFNSLSKEARREREKNDRTEVDWRCLIIWNKMWETNKVYSSIYLACAACFVAQTFDSKKTTSSTTTKKKKKKKKEKKRKTASNCNIFSLVFIERFSTRVSTFDAGGRWNTRQKMF